MSAARRRHRMLLTVCLMCLVGLVWMARSWVLEALGGSLACREAATTAEALVVDNFDPDYLLFERARQLKRRNTGLRVLVPVRVDVPGSESFSPVALGITEVLVRLSHIGRVEFVPMREVEPITLNAAKDIREYLTAHGIRSVRVVTPLFRSRRAMLVYQPVFGERGVATSCEPVQGSRGVSTWHHTWHGVQEVVQQWLKLQYYRFHVRPGS